MGELVWLCSSWLDFEFVFPGNKLCNCMSFDSPTSAHLMPISALFDGGVMVLEGVMPMQVSQK